MNIHSVNILMLISFFMVDTDICNNHQSDFKFKFISGNEFSSIVKHVQRTRRKKLEEKEWKNYLETKKERERVKQESVSSSIDCHSCAEDSCLNVNGCCIQYLSENNDSSRAEGHYVNTSVRQRGRKDRNFSEKGPYFDSALSLIPYSELQRVGELRSRLIFTLRQLLKLDNSNTEDSDQDISRLRRRGVEFMARFTRNYLYQIKCQVGEIKRHLLMPSSARNQFNCQKMLSSHQIGIQALQAFEKNVSFCLIDSVPNQIVEFLAYMRELSIITRQVMFNDMDNEDGEVENLCNAVIKHFSKIEKCKRSPVTCRKVPQKSNKSPTKKEKNHDNLRMYDPDSKAVWKKKSAALARIKFGPPKQNNNNRHKPAVTKKSQNEESEDVKMPESLLIRSINDMTSSFNTAINDLQELLNSVKQVTQIEKSTRNEPHFSWKAVQREHQTGDNSNVRMIIMKEDSENSDESESTKGGSMKSRRKNHIKTKKLKPRLSDEERYIALDYKHFFNQYKKSCFYYQCPNKDKPWNIVSRIADVIVNRITSEVARELEADTLIQKLIENEFEK